MPSKHSFVSMFICTPINKCAPRLKLQYTVQIQQSKWYFPCTAQRCRDLYDAHFKDCPKDGHRRRKKSKEGSLIIVKFNTAFLKDGFIRSGSISCPQFYPSICNFHSLLSLCKYPAGLIISSRSSSSSSFAVSFLSLLGCRFLSAPDTSPFAKSS